MTTVTFTDDELRAIASRTTFIYNALDGVAFEFVRDIENTTSPWYTAHEKIRKVVEERASAMIKSETY